MLCTNFTKAKAIKLILKLCFGCKINSITHEPQLEALRTDAVDLRSQQILGDSVDLVGGGNGAGQRARPRLHLKRHVLHLQRHRFTLTHTDKLRLLIPKEILVSEVAQK